MRWSGSFPIGASKNIKSETFTLNPNINIKEVIVSNKEIDYFFSCLDQVLNAGENLRSLELIIDFIKSKIK